MNMIDSSSGPESQYLNLQLLDDNYVGWGGMLLIWDDLY